MAKKSAETVPKDNRLELLSKITSQTSESLDEQFHQALKLTTDLLGMEIGIISRIEDDTYMVKSFYPEDCGLEIGQTFDVGETYCSITLNQEDVVAIDYMKQSPYSRHPCYKLLNLESYIGMALEVDGRLYGTLNFSSSKPRDTGSTETDNDLIRILGSWVEAMLKRKQLEEHNL